MDFFQKAKETLTEAGKEISVAGREISQKASEFSSTTKMNFQLKEEEKQLDAAFVQLGREFFAKHPEEARNDFPDLVSYIENKMSYIDHLKEQMNQNNQYGNEPGKPIGEVQMKICPKCGTSLYPEDQFCFKCGSKL